MKEVDNIAVYKFIKKISTPFKKWRAFKHGIIDEHGNILKNNNEFTTRNEKDSFTKFDLLVLNIKKSLGKIPGGESRMASYAAALFLIKENSDVFVDMNSFEGDVENIVESINEYILSNNILEEVPANHVSTSAIAGLGTDSYSPKIHHHVMKRHKERNKKNKEISKDESK